jgi:hypothetical protein
MFKVGDRVVGTDKAISHRVGMLGVITRVNLSETFWVRWGEECYSNLVLHDEIELVKEEPMYKEWQHTPDSEKVKILEAELRGEVIEWAVWAGVAEKGNWNTDGRKGGEYHFNLYYRIKPVSKPSINWDHVEERFKWLTVDQNGAGRLWVNKPVPLKDQWHWGANSTVYEAYGLSSFNRGDCPWDKSLVGRDYVST